MTDAEQLAIAEEIWVGLSSYSVRLDGINVSWLKPYFIAKRRVCGPNDGEVLCQVDADKYVSRFAAIIDCVRVAKAKLAAEHEAAMTPRERKLRDRVTRIRNYVQNGGDWDKTIITLCDEALEES